MEEDKPEPDDTERCSDHGKNIEGYCIQDKKLLCIDCILSGKHKNHEITNIINGAKHEKEALTKLFKTSEAIREGLMQANVKIVGHAESLRAQAQDSISKLQNIYQHVIQILQEREIN